MRRVNAWPRRPARTAPAFREISRRLPARCFRGLARLRRRQIDTRPASLRQADGDRLFGGSGAVHAFPDVIHLFFDELAGLGRRGFPLAFVGPCSGQCLLFGHISPVGRDFSAD
jgi:hypothetical protein